MKQVESTCRHCGKAFKYYPQRQRGIYCSAECYRAHVEEERLRKLREKLEK